MMAVCPLCKSESNFFCEYKTKIYYNCSCCNSIFLSENQRLSYEEEKQRYEKHENNVEDKNYQKFVTPITSNIIKDFKKTEKGLDFGAGTGPVISKILTDAGYTIKQYDPYFHNYPELLNEKYNFIACCEVIEHFFYPYKEFKLLKEILFPNGKLYCMTDIYNKSIDFEKWYYKNDPTHVFIYQKETFEWIKKEFEFSELKIDGRLIVLS